MYRYIKYIIDNTNIVDIFYTYTIYIYIGMVICPICKTKDIIKGVRYLPLNISILKQIVDLNNTGMSTSMLLIYYNCIYVI